MSTAAVQPPGASHDAAMPCPGCGYDLRGNNDGTRCPECGLVIDRTALASAAVPWAHRRSIGVGRSYRNTLRLVMLRPARVAAAVGEGHRWDDACRFRERTARRVFVLPLTLIVAAYAVTLSIPNKPPVLRGLTFQIVQSLKPLGLEWLAQARRAEFSPAYAAEVVVVLVTLAGAYLAARAAVSLGGCFFASARMSAGERARAAALGAYATAPLSLLAPAVPLLLLATHEFACWASPRSGLNPPGDSPLALDTFPRISLLALALTATPWVWTWVTTLVLLRHASRGHGGGWARVIAAAVVLPAAWAVLPLLIILGTFASALLVAMVILSVM